MLTKVKNILVLILLLFIVSCGNDKISEENSNEGVIKINGVKGKASGGEVDGKGETIDISNGNLEIPIKKPNIIK